MAGKSRPPKGDSTEAFAPSGLRRNPRPWRPKAGTPNGKRRIDSHDPSSLLLPPPKVTVGDVVRVQEALPDLFELKDKEQERLRLDLTDLITIFQTMRISQGRPAPSEIRERMKSIKTHADNLLAALGFDPADAGSIYDRSAYSHEMNPTITAIIVSAAASDSHNRLARASAQDLILSCCTATAGLIVFSERAQRMLKSEKPNKNEDTARLFLISGLAVTYHQIFQETPTTAAGGPWFRFLRSVLTLAGEPLGTLSDDALKHAWLTVKAREKKEN